MPQEDPEESKGRNNRYSPSNEGVTREIYHLEREPEPPQTSAETYEVKKAPPYSVSNHFKKAVKKEKSRGVFKDEAQATNENKGSRQTPVFSETIERNRGEKMGTSKPEVVEVLP